MSDDNYKQGFNTIAVHGGYHVASGGVNPPLGNSSTFKFQSCDDGAARFASKEKKGIYTRLDDPLVRALSDRVAMMEHGYGGIAMASGMAAGSAINFALLKPGDHVIATASMYGPSRSILEKKQYYSKWGVEATFVDTSDTDLVKYALKENTVAIIGETPANPTLAITDIEKMSWIAKENNLYLVVDNTFCSPYLQNPLDFGADVVFHSMTKSIGGHSRAVGGMIVPKTEELYDHIRDIVINTGGILSPETANVFLSGIGTLGLRMERMQENAQEFSEYLNEHDAVKWVNYPGLKSHPSYAFVKEGTQMRGPGNMITFGFNGGYEQAKNVLDNLELITLAVSLGGIESLIEHPASMTHAGVAEKERLEAGITPDLVRLSVGIEELPDLIYDFEQALKKSN